MFIQKRHRLEASNPHACSCALIFDSSEQSITDLLRELFFGDGGKVVSGRECSLLEGACFEDLGGTIGKVNSAFGVDLLVWRAMPYWNVSKSPSGKSSHRYW